MRIGMLTYGMGEHLTGIGKYTRELCLAMQRTDPRVEIILINPYSVERQDFFRSFENYHVPLLQKLPAVLTVGPALVPMLSRRLGLDVFHDPCGISPFVLPRRKNGSRRVVTIHDAVPFVFPDVQPFLTKFTFRTLISAARWNADAILTVSESSRQDLMRYVGFSQEKIHVTYHGVSVPTQTDLMKRRTSVHVLKKWSLLAPFFLYVGALNPRKNVPTLISAFEHVLKVRNDLKLVLVGPNTWWADETLQAAQRFRESVVVTGYVSDEELGTLYAHASALVYPSIYEGFGLPPLEAMAYGTPVITSNVSSLPEVIGDAGLMIDPRNVKDLAQSMLRVLEPLLAGELSEKGRIRVEQFRWENTARQTLDVYQSLLSGGFVRVPDLNIGVSPKGTPLQSEHRLRGLGTYTLNLAMELVALVPGEIRFAATVQDLDLLPDSIRRTAVSARRGHRPAQVYWVYNELFLRNITKRVAPSVIHSTDFNGLVVQSGIPTIATLHDITVLKEGLRHSGLSARMSDLRWWVYFYQKLPKAAHIIAISNTVKEDAMRLLGIPGEKITVIPHGIDMNIFHPNTCIHRTERPYLLFVGGRNENKNLSRVLTAFSLLHSEFPDLLLFIAGAWSARDLQWLKEQITDLRIAKCVKHLGYVPDTELSGLYSNSVAFLFPSLEEGFGLPILEAMACGTPVVTSDRGAMREVSGRAAQLVNPENVDALIRSIREIITKPLLRERLIELGRERASEFSWKSAAQKTLEVYQTFYKAKSNYSL